MAKRAAILQHGFAKLGIIALVDEATGYQEVRARDALAKILERFVAKELRPWMKTFPAEYYREIFRLNGWEYAENCGRPGVIGHWTNNIIYKRLAPGVWDELNRISARDNRGRLKNKLFQRTHGGHRSSQIARTSYGRCHADEILAELENIHGPARSRISAMGDNNDAAISG